MKPLSRDSPNETEGSVSAPATPQPRGGFPIQKLLVTGASGLLGGNLAWRASGQYQVFGVSRSASLPHVPWRHVRCDLADKTSTHRCLGLIAPDVIVHAAAMTDVDACERDPELAAEQNVLASSTIAEWARAHNAFLLYISTDAVFDGAEGGYAEDAPPKPLNAYARTKLLGEESVRLICPGSLILRTSLYGWNSRDKLGLAEWVLRGLLEKERRTMFTDVYFSPLYAGDLARVILDLLPMREAGVYHAGASDSCSKHAFSRLLAETFGLDAAPIVPICLKDLPLAAQRPKNTTLRVAKLRNLLGRPMPTMAEGVRRFRDSLRTGFVKSLKGELPRWLADRGDG